MAKRKASTPSKWAKSDTHKRLICIRWRDHTSLDDWIAEKEIVEKLFAHEMLSVGFLIDENAEAYYIAGTLDAMSENIGDSRCILKGTVVKVIDIGHE